jgi:hypothetical protein
MHIRLAQQQQFVLTVDRRGSQQALLLGEISFDLLATPYSRVAGNKLALTGPPLATEHVSVWIRFRVLRGSFKVLLGYLPPSRPKKSCRDGTTSEWHGTPVPAHRGPVRLVPVYEIEFIDRTDNRW